MVLNPPGNSVPEFIGCGGIAEQRMLQTLAQGIGYEIRGLKIQVGHPEGYQVITAVTLLEHAVLECVGTRTVYYLVKIVFHICLNFIVQEPDGYRPECPRGPPDLPTDVSWCRAHPYRPVAAP